MAYTYVGKDAKDREEKTPFVSSDKDGNDDVRSTAAKVQDKLVDSIFIHVHRSIIFFPIVASVCGWAGGQPPMQFINPLFVSLAGALPTMFRGSPWTQIGIVLLMISFPILRHAIFYQGCSACHVPVLYGFVPCATGFLFRTTQAILVSTIYGMSIILFIFAVDLSGNCPSEPIDPSDKGSIIADRLMPLFMLIGGNSILVYAILKHSQESLALQAKAAVQASKLATMRRDVLHRVTHELRTPLNGLIGSVELLTASETLTEHDMDNVLTMQRCLTSILGICDDVLTVAKSNTKSTQVKRQNSSGNLTKKDEMGESSSNRQIGDDCHPFVLAGVVDDVSEMFGATVTAKRLQLKVDFQGDTRAVYYGMEVKLRQILLNLVGNALKFTELGSITIRVRTSQAEQSTTKRKTRVRFEVEDTGDGIDSAEAKLLFEPFHQGEQNEGGAVARRHKGTGLGLTICRDLVKLFDGDIGADGTLGKGSCFHFAVNLQQVQDESQERDATASAQQTLKQSLPSSSGQDDNSIRLEGIGSTTDLVKANDVPDSSSSMQMQMLILIADSEKDSRQSCQSVIKSVAPSWARVIALDSHFALQQYLDGAVNTDVVDMHATKHCRRVALVECDPSETTIFSTLSRMQDLGWQTIVYCHRTAFSQVVQKPTGALAVFPRPIPLVRVGNALRAALMGEKLMAVESSAHVESTTGNIAAQQQATQEPQHPTLPSPTIAGTPPPNPERPSGGKLVRTRKPDKIQLGPRHKVVVVDDTAVNVKVLVKMLSRLTSAPIQSYSDGQSAVEMVMSSDPNDIFLFLMDWHMPGVCGLSATKLIRKIALERNGPAVQICILTADIEGLQLELKRRSVTYDGVAKKGEFIRGATLPDDTNMMSTTSIDSEESASVEPTISIEIVASKPVTFQSLQAIFTGFNIDRD